MVEKLKIGYNSKIPALFGARGFTLLRRENLTDSVPQRCGLEQLLIFQPHQSDLDAAAKREKIMPVSTKALQPNTPAPDFSLASTMGQTLSLSDFRGQPVILAFYPADGSPVCSSQLALYNEVLPLFAEFKAQLLAISVDDISSHHAFAGQYNLKFPLLADFEPTGMVSRAYGVFDEDEQTSQRALFVIDREGIIRWSYVSPSGVNPGANGILEALEDLDA